MASPVAHPVVCGEDKGGLAIVIEILDEFRDLPYPVIDDLDVV
jgi:hypothetical protein